MSTLILTKSLIIEENIHGYTYFSLRITCRVMNRVVRMAKPIKQPQTLGEDHGSLFPTHCRARKRHTKLEVRRIAPIGSSRMSFSDRVRSL